MTAVLLGMATTSQAAASRLAPCCLRQDVSAGGCGCKPQARSHGAEGTVAELGAARQRSEAQWHSGARRSAAARQAAPCPQGRRDAGGAASKPQAGRSPSPSR